MIFKSLTIQRKLVAVILLTSFIVLLLTCGVLLMYELQSYKAATRRNLSTLAQVIANNSTAILIYDDQKLAQEILSAFKAEPDIAAAALYDGEENLYATYPPNSPAGNFPVHPLPSEPLDFAGNQVTIFQPVLQGKSQVGTVYLQADLRGMYRRFGVYGLVVLGVLFGSGLVALLLSNLFQRRITQPILDLAAAAKIVSERKDYSVRAVISSDDELGYLTAAFNSMLGDIETSHAALRESEDRFRTLTEASPAITWVCGPDGQAEYFNSRWYEYTGMDLSESAGSGWFDAVQKDDRASCLDKWNRSLRTRAPYEAETRYRRADGVYRWYLTRAVPLRDNEGRVLKWLGTSTDIEGPKQTERELEEAQTKLKAHAAELEQRVADRTAKLSETVGELEALSYSVSHDMRAPLRAMQGYADYFLQTYAEQIPADGIKYLERIMTAARRLDSLIQDVLSYSRVLREDMTLQPVDLQALVENIVAEFPNFQPPQVQIEIQKPLLPVCGHEASLTQVISNLFANAVKFVRDSEAPHLRVWTEDRGSKVRFWVQDNGIGIAQSDLHRIFGIFERVHAEQTYEGTGIGLSIVRKAIERMGGTVGVDSELGKGSKFWFELPKA